jgi:phosphate transport system permease protein
MPDTLFDSGRALSVHIYDLAMNVAGGDNNAYASALVLMILLLIINTLAASLGHHWLHRRSITA